MLAAARTKSLIFARRLLAGRLRRVFGGLFRLSFLIHTLRSYSRGWRERRDGPLCLCVGINGLLLIRIAGRRRYRSAGNGLE